MKRILAITTLVFCSLFASTGAKAQILDGYWSDDMAGLFHDYLGTPGWLTNSMLPWASVTQIVNGNVLIGEHLNERVTLGIEGIASTDFVWEFKAIKLDDGSGSIITLEMKIVDTMFGSDVRVEKQKSIIMLRPGDIIQLFRDKAFEEKVKAYLGAFYSYRMASGQTYNPNQYAADAYSWYYTNYVLPNFWKEDTSTMGVPQVIP